jgi:hypothetical protein
MACVVWTVRQICAENRGTLFGCAAFRSAPSDASHLALGRKRQQRTVTVWVPPHSGCIWCMVYGVDAMSWECYETHPHSTASMVRRRKWAQGTPAVAVCYRRNCHRFHHALQWTSAPVLLAKGTHSSHIRCSGRAAAMPLLGVHGMITFLPSSSNTTSYLLTSSSARGHISDNRQYTRTVVRGWLPWTAPAPPASLAALDAAANAAASASCGRTI